MRHSSNSKKAIRWLNNKLYLKKGKQIILLGNINTHKGGLTRAQKIMAVAADGEWVDI